jgi:hypothetical protein
VAGRSWSPRLPKAPDRCRHQHGAGLLRKPRNYLWSDAGVTALDRALGGTEGAVYGLEERLRAPRDGSRTFHSPSVGACVSNWRFVSLPPVRPRPRGGSSGRTAPIMTGWRRNCAWPSSPATRMLTYPEEHYLNRYPQLERQSRHWAPAKSRVREAGERTQRDRHSQSRPAARIPPTAAGFSTEEQGQGRCPPRPLPQTLAPLDSGGGSSLATRLAANENNGLFLGTVKTQPRDISMVDKPGTFLMWYDNAAAIS